VADAARQRAWTLRDSVVGKFEVGPISDTFVTGFDYQETLIDAVAGVRTPFQALPTLNHDGHTPTGMPRGEDSWTHQFFVQDQVQYKRFYLLASIAYTSTDANDAGAEEKSGAWTPNLGPLCDLSKNVSAYATYQRAYVPQNMALLAGSVMASRSTLGKVSKSV